MTTPSAGSASAAAATTSEAESKAAEERVRQDDLERERLVEERKQAAEQVRLEEEQRQVAEQARLEGERKQAAAEKARLEQEERERIQQEPTPAAQPRPNFFLSLGFPTSSWGKAAVIGVIWAVWEVFVNYVGQFFLLAASHGFYWVYPPLITVIAILILKGCGFGLSLGVYLGWTKPRSLRRYLMGSVVIWAAAFQLSVLAAWVWPGPAYGEFLHEMRIEEITRGVVAGALMILLLRRAHRSLPLRQISTIALGYAAAGVASYYVLVKMVPALHDSGYTYWMYDLAYKSFISQGPCMLAAFLFGIIGSGVMFWQLSRANVKDP